MTPLEGKITTVQLFIISRILDVERRKDGNNDEKKVELLINSIKTRRFAPNISAGSITEYPVGMNDETHRTAYHVVYSPNSFLPYNGEEFLKEVGLSVIELEKLKTDI